jgi:Ca-activated chloride channel family protein
MRRLRAIAVALASLAPLVCAPRVEPSQGVPPPPPEPGARPAPKAQENDEVRLDANLVTVTLVVRDAAGALVTDLGPKDFAVYEEGASQDVGGFYRTDEVPLRLALLFDASISVKDRLDFEKRAASRFFADVLGPRDQAALYSVSTDWKLEQGLTASADALGAALRRLNADGITSLFGAIDGASRYLGGVDGRRVVLLLSDGYDTAGETTLDASLEIAQRSDIVIFAISPAGTGGEVTPAARIGEASLRRLAEQTGGVAFFPPVERDNARETASLDEIYRRVAAELRAQYVLTFYSSAPRDGRFHALRVDVKRPGLSVTARKGYYAK